MRAWRDFDRFDGRAALRTWLFRIATNVWLDAVADRARRTLAVGGAVPAPRHDTFWGSEFRMLTDKFGVRWMFTCEPSR